MKSSFTFLLPLLFALACGDDDRGGDDDAGTAMDSGPRPDAGPLPADTGPAPTDAGPLPTDSGPADVDAGPAATGCCAPDAPPCLAGLVCDPTRCECVTDPAGCCTLIRCMRGYSCVPETCDCELTPCDPPCAPDFTCFAGTCVAACVRDGCPDGEWCSDTGCVPNRCSDDECLAMSSDPIYHCDPTTGCYDPCALGEWSWCTSRGGRCLAGHCVDATCASGTLECSYRYDCCGEAHCLSASDGEPPCPVVCPASPRLVHRPTDCACNVDGRCGDLRGPPFFAPPMMP